ncbi:MAG: hypothetical protein HYV63_24525 [Candidatus Schekmanbacteria bacterium]|nr:hypothetical protein [Candidatus Schekmanbacteria bacterium]
MPSSFVSLRQDPETGELFSRGLLALSLRPGEGLRVTNPPRVRPLGRLLGMLRGEEAVWGPFLLAGVCTALLALVPALFVPLTVDWLLAAASPWSLYWSFGALLGLEMVRQLLAWCHARLGSDLAMALDKRILTALFSRLGALREEFFLTRLIGDLYNRVYEGFLLRNFLTQAVSVIVLDGLLVLVCVPLLVVLDVPLGLLGIGLLASFLIFFFTSNRVLRRSYRRELVEAGMLMSLCLEVLVGFKSLKLLRAEGRTLQRLDYFLRPLGAGGVELRPAPGVGDDARLGDDPRWRIPGVVGGEPEDLKRRALAWPGARAGGRAPHGPGGGAAHPGLRGGRGTYRESGRTRAGVPDRHGGGGCGRATAVLWRPTEVSGRDRARLRQLPLRGERAGACRSQPAHRRRATRVPAGSNRRRQEHARPPAAPARGAAGG